MQYTKEPTRVRDCVSVLRLLTGKCEADLRLPMGSVPRNARHQFRKLPQLASRKRPTVKHISRGATHYAGFWKADCVALGAEKTFRSAGNNVEHFSKYDFAAR